MPNPPLRKIAVGIAQSDPNRMYALIETGGNGRGSLWRSDDGGNAWHVVNYSRLLNERPHYYTRLMISSADANEVYFPSNSIWYTLDGGKTVYPTDWGGDNHAMWADPTNANRMMIGCDVGVLISTTHDKQWHQVILPIGQMYHVAVDNQMPYNLYGNMQDDESVRGPSNTRTFGPIPSSIWTSTAGCESGFSFPDPVDNNIVWGGNFHQMDNRDPYIYKTSDYGKTWTFISGGIPKSVFSYVHVVIEDPFRKGLLFAGTENSLYVSFDDGGHWTPMQTNLPHVPVSWMVIQKHFHELDISTKGRGFYILDDITPLEQLTPEVLNPPAFLFKMRPTYRFRRVSETRGVADDPSAGRNPSYGADINYYLKAVPKGDVTITVLDSQNNVGRNFKGTKHAGINRVYWDLRYPSVKEIQLRTTPASYPQIWSDSRFIGRKTRPIYHWGIEQPRLGALAAPGTYRVKLALDGQSYTQPLTILKDRHSAGTVADVEASVQMWRAIDADIDTVVDMINSIERVRKQIQDLPVYIKGRPHASEILSSAKQLDAGLQSVEYKLFEKYLAAGDEKTYPEEMQLYQKLLWLAGQVGDGAGDVAGNPDFPPTDEEVTVFNLLRQHLVNVETQYSSLMNKAIPAFNSRMRARGVAIILNPAKLAQ